MAVAGLAGKKGEKPRSNVQGQPRSKMSSPKARPLPEEGPSRGRLLEQQSKQKVQRNPKQRHERSRTCWQPAVETKQAADAQKLARARGN